MLTLTEILRYQERAAAMCRDLGLDPNMQVVIPGGQSGPVARTYADLWQSSGLPLGALEEVSLGGGRVDPTEVEAFRTRDDRQFTIGCLCWVHGEFASHPIIAKGALVTLDPCRLYTLTFLDGYHFLYSGSLVQVLLPSGHASSNRLYRLEPIKPEDMGKTPEEVQAKRDEADRRKRAEQSR